MNILIKLKKNDKFWVRISEHHISDQLATRLLSEDPSGCGHGPIVADVAFEVVS